MPSSQPRTTDTHALSSSVPTSLSSSSLSSSLSSSRASSDLLPAAPLSNSSQSDIITSDRSVSSLSSSSKPRFFPLVLSSTSAPPRSASLANMGQGQSQARPAAPLSPPPLSPAPSTTSSTGNRLKRAWAGRRKKSEDITALFASTERAGKSREREVVPDVARPPPPSAMPDLNDLKLERPPSRGLGGAKLHLPNVFGGRKASQQPRSPIVLESTAAPPPPPKPVSVGQRTTSSSLPHTPAKDAQFPAAISLPKQSSPAHAIDHSRQPSEGGDAGTSTVAEKSQDKDKAKEDWRKSDSTMASHSTIRPGALSGNRSPRPVSLAESSHSGNTIVPPVNKRLSALITDAEFTMFEETDGSLSDHESISRPPASGRPSPTSSLKARNRRSASLSVATLRRPDASGKSSPPSTSHSPPGRNLVENPLASSRDNPTLTRTAAAGIISSVNAGGSAQTAGHNIRGRLAAWSAVQASSPQTQVERPLPNLPPPQPRRQPGVLNPPPVNPTFRQTAVSMTGSLAPAAGIAMGFGKRAVEKVGRAWGGLTSSASNHSGYSSSSSTGLSDSASGYASSHQSGPSGRKARRKAPHAFSNASSISSLASSSSEDHFVPAGPQLGRRVRGPKLSSSGMSVVGGLVFRRNLSSCVRETAIDDVLIRIATGQQENSSCSKPLEERLLPALVVRCAQHILRWGVQEEGLFRVSGRSSHVAKIRSEFDAGADYDLTECEPGDLDPHSVSSIFKTFLRELPEPILTAALHPIFESALADDQGRRSEDVTQQPPSGPRQPSNLPLRKPPSLSTLAMPSFAGARAVSDAQLSMFSYLICQLPPENRDLLYTVVELVKATASRSKDTKMPLGNLLLVFCPSLNMSPSLLRILCEADGIWDGSPAQSTSAVSTPSNSAFNRAATRVPTTVDLRFPVVEVDDAMDSHDSPDDAASFVSALEPPSNAPTRTPSPLIYGATLPLLSSSDSLDSSSVSEELVSPDPPSCRSVANSKSPLASANSLTIPDMPSVRLVTPRPNVSAPVPVPFPSAAGSAPQSPVIHAPLAHRKSYTLLSFPHTRNESDSDYPSDEPSPTRRPKRPSLHLLFSKKSTSSLPSAGSVKPPSAALNVSAGSASLKMRPNLHNTSSPPRLDTNISSSPIHLGFDANVNHLRSKDSSTVRSAPASVSPPPPTPPEKLAAPGLTARTDSGGSSLFSTPQSTPIADYYRGRTTSLFIPDTPGELSPPLRARSASQVSDSPSIDLDVPETLSDDWTQSVLLAAQGSS